MGRQVKAAGAFFLGTRERDQGMRGSRALLPRQRLVKDLSFYRRYLHQPGFRTYVDGKYDVLLTAVRGPPLAG